MIPTEQLAQRLAYLRQALSIRRTETEDLQKIVRDLEETLIERRKREAKANQNQTATETYASHRLNRSQLKDRLDSIAEDMKILHNDLTSSRADVSRELVRLRVQQIIVNHGLLK